MTHSGFFWNPSVTEARGLVYGAMEGHGCISLIVMKPGEYQCRPGRSLEDRREVPRPQQVPPESQLNIDDKGYVKLSSKQEMGFTQPLDMPNGNLF